MDFRRYSLPWYAYLFLGYALAGVIWWMVLLVQKNHETYTVRINEIAYTAAVEHTLRPGQQLEDTPEFQLAHNRYIAQRSMILMEGILLLGCMLGGVWFIYRSLRKRLEAADQQRSFLLSITHELKSPVAGIRLSLDTFRKRDRLSDEQRLRLADRGIKEADRLTQLLNDLLLSAQLEATYQLNKTPLDLDRLLRETAEKVSIKYPNATIDLDINDHLPAFLGDEGGMTSVIQNLVENAAKYSSPDPHIRLSLDQNGPAELVLHVDDNGSGIPNTHKRKVFRKFYRIGNEDTRTAKGTGLGLFIVDELVRRHKGLVEIHDSPLGGARFTVRLPV